LGSVGGSRGITAHPDGGLWVIGGGLNTKVGCFSTAGILTNLYSLPSGVDPNFITAGPDGNMWFTEFVGGNVGRVTPSGTVTQFPLPNAACPERITAGPDGNVWLADDCSSLVSSVTPSGGITQYSATNYATNSGFGGCSFGAAAGP